MNIIVLSSNLMSLMYAFHIEHEKLGVSTLMMNKFISIHLYYFWPFNLIHLSDPDTLFTAQFLCYLWICIKIYFLCANALSIIMSQTTFQNI